MEIPSQSKSRFGAPCGRTKRWSSSSKFSSITPGHRIARDGVGRLWDLSSSREILSAAELKPNSLAKLVLQQAIASCWPASDIKDDSRSVHLLRLPHIVQMLRSCLLIILEHCKARPQTRGCDVSSPLIAEHAILRRTKSSSLAMPPFMIAVKRPTISSRFLGIELTQTPREGFTMVATKSLYLSVADESDMQLCRTHCCSIGVSSLIISCIFASLCLTSALFLISCRMSFTAPSPWYMRALRSCAAQNFRANRTGARTTSRLWNDMKWSGSLKPLHKEGRTKWLLQNAMLNHIRSPSKFYGCWMLLMSLLLSILSLHFVVKTTSHCNL